MDVFKNEREFNNKFKSKIFICSNCGTMTSQKYVCPRCKNQSTNLFCTGKTYTYKIEETGKIETIFTPIEKENSCNK